MLMIKVDFYGISYLHGDIPLLALRPVALFKDLFGHKAFHTGLTLRFFHLSRHDSCLNLADLPIHGIALFEILRLAI